MLKCARLQYPPINKLALGLPPSTPSTSELVLLTPRCHQPHLHTLLLAGTVPCRCPSQSRGTSVCNTIGYCTRVSGLLAAASWQLGQGVRLPKRYALGFHPLFPFLRLSACAYASCMRAVFCTGTDTDTAPSHQYTFYPLPHTHEAHDANFHACTFHSPFLHSRQHFSPFVLQLSIRVPRRLLHPPHPNTVLA